MCSSDLQLSGPGTSTFGNSSLVDTIVSFSTTGLYGLRLTATDGEVITYDDTTVNWSAPPPIESWRTGTFGGNAGNPAVAGNLADPELDGTTNLVEYALALNPLAPSPHQLPTAVMDDRTIELTWRRNKAATDITIQVQTSPDAGDWTTVTPTNTIVSDEGQVQVIRSSVPRTGDRQFIRLLVLPPVP